MPICISLHYQCEIVNIYVPYVNMYGLVDNYARHVDNMLNNATIRIQCKKDRLCTQ